MRFLLLIILATLSFCKSTNAQFIPEMPYLPAIPTKDDNPNYPVGKDPGMINPIIPAHFRGGTDSLVAYLRLHIKLPLLKSDNRKMYSLIVAIKLDSCGKTTEVDTPWETENEWPEMEEQVKIVIKKMPDWIPATSQDRKARFKSLEVFELYAQNNHLVVEIARKYFKIY